jgi:hypothetical protein
MSTLYVPPWLKAWINSSDTGISSMTIAYALVGAIDLLDRKGAPRDTSDVGRCVRLLDAAAAGGDDWRSRLGEVAALCPEWAPLVPIWPQIEAAFHEDVAVQTAARAAYRKVEREAYLAHRIAHSAWLAEHGVDDLTTDEDAPFYDKPREPPLPPSRCWWLVATARKNGYDPYEKHKPHPFKVPVESP